MKFDSDIDIDFADRSEILQHIKFVSAHMKTMDGVKKHPTGIYVTDIPYDPINDWAALEYKTAEDRNYMKLDLLNVWVYKHVRNEQHLLELMREPNWAKLYDKEFFQALIHIGEHYDTMKKMPEPIDSVARMAMFLAVIRPAKRHLIGKTWKDVSLTVWDRSVQDGYSFKKSHSISYAHLVVVHMNLISELGLHAFDQSNTSTLYSTFA